jgi:hypothetical protein
LSIETSIESESCPSETSIESVLSIGNIHRIWTAVQSNIKDVRRGGIKARLLNK